MGDIKVKPATGNQNKNATGPQKSGFAVKYNSNDLRFPKEVAINAQNKHWIQFVPTIQQAGSYNVKLSGETNLADANRRNTGGQLGSNPLSFSDNLRAAGILAAVNGVGSVGKELMDLITKGKFNPTAAKKAAGEAIKGGAGGFLGGLFGGVVLSGIDLSRKTRRAASYISLYMPDTVNFTIVNDYDQVSLTQALGKAGLALQAGKEITTGDLKAVGGGIGPAGLEVAGAVAQQTGNFGEKITDVLLFSAGYAQNPQIELLFKSIQNREFLFDFKLVAKTKDEATAIKNIIQAFRFHAAPEIPKTGGGRYFVPPDEFDIRFMFGDKINPNLPKISSCVLQGIDINYASAGQWTTFWDGSPVEVAVQLRFKEVEIMHKALVNEGF